MIVKIVTDQTEETEVTHQQRDLEMIIETIDMTGTMGDREMPLVDVNLSGVQEVGEEAEVSEEEVTLKEGMAEVGVAAGVVEITEATMVAWITEVQDRVAHLMLNRIDPSI